MRDKDKAIRKTILVPPDHIHENPNNPRREAGNVTALARSLKDEMLQDLLVIPAPQYGPGHYLLEDGYRRWVACKVTGEHLPCKVRFPAPDEDLVIRAIVTGLITDIHKKPLSAMERAWAYGRLRDQYGKSQTEIATLLSLSVGTIGRYLSLLELADKHQMQIQNGTLSVERAIEMIRKYHAKGRQKKGHRPIDVGWEPDHFTSKHHLAKLARKLCEARKHKNRRPLGGVACQQCWEDAIRQDQTTILQAAYQDSQRESVNPAFLPPFQTADGAARNGVIGNGI